MKRLIEKLGVHACLTSLLVTVLFFGLAVAASAQSFTVNNLTADVPGVAANTDPISSDPWGCRVGSSASGGSQILARQLPRSTMETVLPALSS